MSHSSKPEIITYLGNKYLYIDTFLYDYNNCIEFIAICEKNKNFNMFLPNSNTSISSGKKSKVNIEGKTILTTLSTSASYWELKELLNMLEPKQKFNKDQIVWYLNTEKTIESQQVRIIKYHPNENDYTIRFPNGSEKQTIESYLFLENPNLNSNPKSNLISIPKDNINICFVGGVSTGKSTILNAIFCEQLTQCKIKRTTMVPTVYIENESIDSFDPSTIYNTIEEKNQEIIKLTESGHGPKLSKEVYDELVFNVGKLDINILPDSFVNVYDIPGLNDARTKDVYYEYLESNFYKFNLVVFLVDIHSGLNTSDEIDIVNFITTNTRHQLESNNRKIYSLVIVNKADDMQLDEDSDNPDKLILTGELAEMYEQVENTINAEFARKDLSEHLIGIIPLCAIDSYLYRMVKKHGQGFKLSPEQILKIGINENGKKFSTLKPSVQEAKVYEILNDSNFIETMIKLSGFSSLEKILHNFLSQNNTGKQIRIDNLLYDLRKLEKLETLPDKSGWFDLDLVNSTVEKYSSIYLAIKSIDLQLYNEYMSLMAKQIEELLQVHILDLNVEKEELLRLYMEFVEQIIVKYFNQFVQTDKLPEYLTNKLIGMITQELSSTLTIKSMDKIFNFVKRINKFDFQTINQLLNVIVGNIYQENTINFSSEGIKQLIELVNDFIGLGIPVSQFLRFLIINRISSTVKKNDMLIKKLMIYQMYGEIPICNYINSQIDSRDINLKYYIEGLNERILTSSAHELDLFYLNYEKSHCSINFKV